MESNGNRSSTTGRHHEYCCLHVDKFRRVNQFLWSCCERGIHGNESGGIVTELTLWTRGCNTWGNWL